MHAQPPPPRNTGCSLTSADEPCFRPNSCGAPLETQRLKQPPSIVANTVPDAACERATRVLQRGQSYKLDDQMTRKHTFSAWHRAHLTKHAFWGRCWPTPRLLCAGAQDTVDTTFLDPVPGESAGPWPRFCPPRGYRVATLPAVSVGSTAASWTRLTSAQLGSTPSSAIARECS